MHPSRASLTAEWVAAIRGAASRLPAPYAGAPDEAAFSLIPRPLAVLAESIRTSPLPVAAFRALDAATLGLAANVVLRTLRLDELAVDAVARGARQLVVVGAGYDARAFRLDGLGEVTAFEVDHPSTQARKRELLAGLAHRTREHVFVAVDFETQSMEAELLRAGFDAKVPSVWIWEGVTMYLTAEARRGTVRTVAGLSAPGSELLLTYVRPDDLSPPISAFGQLGGKLIGEDVRGLWPTEDVDAELRGGGLAIVEDSGGPEWGARYWPDVPAWRYPVWERIAVGRKR